MKKILFLLSIALSIVLSQESCYYDKGDVLGGEQVCDTTAFTYSLQVEPIISIHCIGCHNSGERIRWS